MSRRSTKATPSTLGARVVGRRAGQCFDIEHGVATEALLFLGDLDPAAIGPSLEHATHYEPTPVGDLDALLEHVPFPLERATFVDLGAGMGRALLLAARHPFRRIVGVEISPALYEVARDNLRAFDPSGLRCRDVRIVRGDARDYRFPRGKLVVYLYNPFGSAILERVIERLAASARSDVALVYHTPVERALVDAHAAFELVADVSTGTVYRLAASRADGTRGRSTQNDKAAPRPIARLAPHVARTPGQP